MLSLISTLGGLLISGLPRFLDFMQDKSDKKHELALAQVQTERELALAKEGHIATQRIEEIRTDQVSMQTDAQMTVAALEHDQKVLDRSSKWVANYVGTVRPTVTYIFVLELVAINIFLAWNIFAIPGFIQNMDDVVKLANTVFSDDEMAMLGGIIGFWFGSRGWNRK